MLCLAEALAAGALHLGQGTQHIALYVHGQTAIVENQFALAEDIVGDALVGLDIYLDVSVGRGQTVHLLRHGCGA